MNWWTSVVVFFIILFSYIHIQHQWKTGDDLEIYEYEYQTHKQLQDTCQWKQPILFPLDLERPSLNALENMNIRDVRDVQQRSHMDLITLSERSARGLLDTDTKSVFYSCRNAVDDDPAWKQWFTSWDPFLRPMFTLYTQHDVLYGSRKTRTTTVFHHESHVFAYLPPETNPTPVQVRMTPSRSKQFMAPVYDYTKYEFWSPVDLFVPHDRIRTVDFLLKPGCVLYIPPYWFYSMEFQDKQNEVCIVKYTTGANCMANAKHHLLYAMQQQNLEERWLKPLEDMDGELFPNGDDNDDNNNNYNNNYNNNDNNDKKEAIVDPSGTSTDPATQLIAELTKSPDNVYGQTEVPRNSKNAPQEQNLA